MRVLLSLVLINSCNSMFWKNGVVHYTINKMDYDAHSQDVITSTLSKLREEICVKFFLQSTSELTVGDKKLLYIGNPDKIKNCQPNIYDFSGRVIRMPIGYKCLNSKAIARTVAEMLRASIEQTVSTINSYDLIKKFQEKEVNSSMPALLNPSVRNFINAHYNLECGALAQRVGNRDDLAQRVGNPGAELPTQLSPENIEYYQDKLWPLGIVMYGIQEELRNTKLHSLLKYAMTSIELPTCIVFEEFKAGQVLSPKNLLWFANSGEDIPQYGFQEGNQSLRLESMVLGAPGHTAHALNNLMRSLGVHMMSNRFDRDNYITIHWKNVENGKERLLEKAPREAWLPQIAYDFDSASHAPANFACQTCGLGAATIQPIQDHLWQRTMTMGHKSELSDADIQLLNILYGKECHNRFFSKKQDNDDVI